MYRAELDIYAAPGRLRDAAAGHYEELVPDVGVAVVEAHAAGPRHDALHGNKMPFHCNLRQYCRR